MCLDRTLPYKQNSCFGYKVLEVENDKLYSILYPYCSFPIDTWVHEKDFRNEFPNIIKNDLGRFQYEIGFHIYRFLNSARNKLLSDKIYLVEFRQQVCQGELDMWWHDGNTYNMFSNDIIVAKEMKLLFEIK